MTALCNEQKVTLTLPKMGIINVYIQGTRSPKEQIILTVHDLGCNHYQYEEFLSNPKMAVLSQKFVWIHVDLPGQGDGDEDLEANFPSMEDIATDLRDLCEQMKLESVVLFGEGAGANILARFAINSEHLVLGAILIHCVGTTASMIESLKDKVINWKLNSIGMNPTAESYLVLHRFGTQSIKFKNAETEIELKNVIESYKYNLKNSINPKNLYKFINSFMTRKYLGERIAKLNTPTLFLTGALAIHSKHVHSLHEVLLKAKPADQKVKYELVQIDGVANVLTEAPEKVVVSLQYFLQGLGLVSNLRLPNEPIKINRRMSMEDYDRPRGTGSFSSSMQSPIKIATLDEAY